MNFSKNLSDLAIKPDDYYSQTRSEMLKYIPNEASFILDVGCGTGNFGQLIKEKKQSIEIWGIELDAESATDAYQKLDRVLTGDVCILADTLPDEYFDCIVFNDILEHLVDPYSLLTKIKSKLKSDGAVVCSLPNVRYLPNLRDLILKKQWNYVDAGILDKTHLRFFTKNSIIDMFDNLDFELQTIEGINPIKSIKFDIINILALGTLSDTRFLQFACVATKKQKTRDLPGLNKTY